MKKGCGASFEYKRKLLEYIKELLFTNIFMKKQNTALLIL